MDRTEGNRAEIELLYRQHGAALLLFASAITGERSRAQDAVHQVFLKLIANGNLRGAQDKKAYLFACTRNAVLNERKFQDRHTPLEFDSAWFSPPDRDIVGERNLRRRWQLFRRISERSWSCTYGATSRFHRLLISWVSVRIRPLHDTDTR